MRVCDVLEVQPEMYELLVLRSPARQTFLSAVLLRLNVVVGDLFDVLDPAASSIEKLRYISRSLFKLLPVEPVERRSGNRQSRLKYSTSPHAY